MANVNPHINQQVSILRAQIDEEAKNLEEKLKALKQKQEALAALESLRLHADAKDDKPSVPAAPTK